MSADVITIAKNRETSETLWSIITALAARTCRPRNCRPAPVVEADHLGAGLPQIIVTMITSNIARTGHPSRVTVRFASERAEGSSVLMDSVIMTDKVTPVQYSEIDRLIGS